MKKIILFIVALVVFILVLFFSFCIFYAYRTSANLKKKYFDCDCVPKEWMILNYKTTDNSNAFEVSSNDFFKAFIFTGKGNKFDELTIENMIKKFEKKLLHSNFNNYKIFINKKLGDKIIFVRFIKENDIENNIVDMLIKKQDGLYTAFVYSKDGMYIKSGSSKDEPLDINANNFISKIE